MQKNEQIINKLYEDLEELKKQSNNNLEEKQISIDKKLFILSKIRDLLNESS